MMENRRKPKYNIPMVVIDTRQQDLRQDYSGQEQNSHDISPSDRDKLPDFGVLLKQLFLGLQKPLIALKYRFFKLLDKWFEDVDVPWIKLIVLALIAFVAFKKDINFNLSFNDDEKAIINTAQNTSLVNKNTFGSNVNPYAPVAAHTLADKKSLDFIKQYKDIAQTEMKKFGIPASIKMAQALIESNAGKSRLARNNNNHFGIKCFSRNCKKGHCTNATDDHHKDFFRKFGSSWESWRAHSNLLMGKRYRSLQNHGKDYKRWAHGLKKAGYATDKNYDKKLINTIEKFQLYKLDTQN